MAHRHKRPRQEQIRDDGNKFDIHDMSPFIGHFPPGFACSEVCNPESKIFFMACARLRREIYEYIMRYALSTGSFLVKPYDKQVVHSVTMELRSYGWDTSYERYEESRAEDYEPTGMEGWIVHVWAAPEAANNDTFTITKLVQLEGEDALDTQVSSPRDSDDSGEKKDS